MLRLDGIDVAFGGVVALRGFRLAMEAGEIHGLIGPNGAGKTTAINVITGLVRPRAGTLALEKQPFVPVPRTLVRHGIGRTFQTPAVFSDLSAVENVMVGAFAQSRAGIASGSVLTPAALREERELRTRALALLGEIGFNGDPDAPAKTLSFGGQRAMEVARVLMGEPRLLLLDEPTAGLPTADVERFGALLRRLRDERAMTILLVEHNVPFVFGTCNTVTAMHEGTTIACGTPAEVRRDEAVVRSYLGAHHAEPEVAARVAEHPDHVLARVPIAGEATERRDLLIVDAVTSGYGGTIVLRDASLRVGTGEAVALFGRNGAGKSTLLGTIMGAPRRRSGTIVWQGRRIDGREPDRVVAAGIGLVPQDRAVIARQSVDDNLLLGTFGLRLSRAERSARREELLTRFPRLAERHDQLAGSLSGGERQMLAIAKVLMRKPALLMLDEPSIGLAPSIVDELAAIVAGLRDEGLAIVVAEQNVTWVVPIADRAYLLDSVRLAREGRPSELAESETLAEHYLGA